VFGVGPATARKWIKSGVSSIEDALLDIDNLARDDSRIAVGMELFLIAAYTYVFTGFTAA
jgi:hypothetical protein